MTDLEKEIIQILLAEYTSLRADVMAKGGHLVGMNSIIAAVVIFIVGSLLNWKPKFENTKSLIFWVSGVALVLYVIALVSAPVLIYKIDREIFGEIDKLAARISEIELDINHRIGEDLLIWENLCGGHATGYEISQPCLPREYLKKKSPPVRTKKGEPITTIEDLQKKP